MWKGRGWSPVSYHGSPWWSEKGNSKGWRIFALVWISFHEYSIRLISVLLEIKLIFIPKVTIFPYCSGEMTNTCFSLAHRVCYNVHLQNRPLNCRHCLHCRSLNGITTLCPEHLTSNHWRQPLFPYAERSVLKFPACKQEMTWQRILSYWDKLFWFYFFFGWNQVLQGFCTDFSITCSFEGSWEEMLGYLVQELYIHRHRHTRICIMYTVCGCMLLRTLFWHYEFSPCIDTFIPGLKWGEENLCH